MGSALARADPSNRYEHVLERRGPQDPGAGPVRSSTVIPLRAWNKRFIAGASCMDFTKTSLLVSYLQGPQIKVPRARLEPARSAPPTDWPLIAVCQFRAATDA